MVSMFASTYQMDDEDTLPYLRVATLYLNIFSRALYTLRGRKTRKKHCRQRPTTPSLTTQCCTAFHEHFGWQCVEHIPALGVQSNPRTATALRGWAASGASAAAAAAP